MQKTIFFTDKYITFSQRASNSYDLVINPCRECQGELPRAKVVHFFEKYNSILYLCSDKQCAYDNFCSQFRRVDAAGGLVENSDGDTLMILRNGRWDLPKGHLEQGESLEECAVREVEEETGIRGITLGEKITSTQHTYMLHGEWILKTTHWYSMHCEAQSTKGQSEEGIEEDRWCGTEQVRENLRSTYPTIRMVFEEK